VNLLDRFGSLIAESISASTDATTSSEFGNQISQILG